MTYRGRKNLAGRRPRRGAVVAELALLLPFLVFAFLVAIDFARIFYYTVTVDNCARNGAMFASQVFNSQEWQGSSAQIQSVQDATVADGGSLSPAISTGNVSVVSGKDADGNSDVVVTVKYTFSTIITYPGLPSQVNVVRTAQMRLAPSTPS